VEFFNVSGDSAIGALGGIFLSLQVSA